MNNNMDLHTCPTCKQQRDLYWITIDELWANSELKFNLRAYNCMTGAGVKTLGRLLSYTPQELLRWKNAGPKTLNIIQELLSEIRLSLPDHDTPGLEQRRTRYYKVYA